jgi:hypothetical protein
MGNNPNYPMFPKAWQSWFLEHMGIIPEDGIQLIERNEFPFDELFAIWDYQFSSDRGYDPSFIPALKRNRVGLVRWVYLDGPEPNWMKSDDAQM